MSDRHHRVESLVRELVANYIQLESNSDPMITVTHVSTSPDYHRVTVFFTTIPEGREEDAFAFLKRSGSEIRHHVKKKSNLKYIPYIDFMVDAGERHRQHIDEIARDIEDQKAGSED